MLAYPQAGDVIKGAVGLRKIRFDDKRRGKGKRGGVRVIYCWWMGGTQFWLFTLYGKGEVEDLTEVKRKALAEMLKLEINVRN